MGDVVYQNAETFECSHANEDQVARLAKDHTSPGMPHDAGEPNAASVKRAANVLSKPLRIC
jgi:hypothetical protein